MSFWDVPGCKAGVVTGEVAWQLLKHAKDKGFAIPAFNCASTSTVNAVLEAGKDLGRPIMVQFSACDAAFFAGGSLPNESGVLQASILGAVAAAHYIRSVAPAYGVPVLLHSDGCAKKQLPWLDGMLEADEAFFGAYGEPMFSSHMLDLSAEPTEENIAVCAQYLKKMTKMNQILEVAVGITGSADKGVDAWGKAKGTQSLYATPADVCKVYEALRPISEKLTIAPAFGSSLGECKPMDPPLKPELLSEFQKQGAQKTGTPSPFLFVFRGASGQEKKDIAAALSSGVVKMNIDTDTQWAYWEGLLSFYKQKEGYLMGQIGNPEGGDKPNKSYYDPRKWVRESEVSMTQRAKESCAAVLNGSLPAGSAKAARPTAVPAYSGLPKHLPAHVLVELKETAMKLCAPGKGFLAADESAGPWLRAGHAEAAKIPDTAENRAAYRSMCFNTPGLSQNISGVILHWETLFQKDATGKDMVDIIRENGMLAGIKLDKAYNKKGIWGTAVGPLGHPEVATLGLDDLQKRCAEAYRKGARFAKWRNVLQLDPEKGLPSNLAIKDTVHTLARYASICQSEGLVPIVEPEIVPNGTHDIHYCAKMTETVLAAQFDALALHHIYLEGAVLKPNMVKNGLAGPRADTKTVAELTVQALLRTVPREMPGIFFLSGETALDEDNEETATINLSMMNKLYQGKLPWSLSFSYGKALQKTCIVTWMGKEANIAAAQKALKARSSANTDAVLGKYVAGTCASVGTDGNVKQADGPY